MKKINLILRKCKSLSRQLARSSSYSNLRSKSVKQDFFMRRTQSQQPDEDDDDEHCVTIYVGSTRKKYVISPKYLNHPLLNALIDQSTKQNEHVLVVNCEVVLFDHLLWMLENADPNFTSESLEELVQLYVF